MANGELVRSRNERIIAGVCGGIAAWLGIPATVARVGWIILSLFPGPLWVAYVLLWVLLPERHT